MDIDEIKHCIYIHFPKTKKFDELLEKYFSSCDEFEVDDVYGDLSHPELILEYLDAAVYEYASMKKEYEPKFTLEEVKLGFFISDDLSRLDLKFLDEYVRFLMLVTVLVKVDILLDILRKNKSKLDEVECEADNLIDIIRDCYFPSSIYQKAVRDVFWLKEECFKLLHLKH